MHYLDEDDGTSQRQEASATMRSQPVGSNHRSCTTLPHEQRVSTPATNNTHSTPVSTSSG